RWWPRGTRNGESSTSLCGGPPGPTRAFSPRQLPTDHDYAVPTREYQSDQPSRQPTRPPPMLRVEGDEQKKRKERADNKTRCHHQRADLTGSFHIRLARHGGPEGPRYAQVKRVLSIMLRWLT